LLANKAGGDDRLLLNFKKVLMWFVTEVDVVAGFGDQAADISMSFIFLIVNAFFYYELFLITLTFRIK